MVYAYIEKYNFKGKAPKDCLIDGDGNLVKVQNLEKNALLAFPHILHNVRVAQKFDIYCGTEGTLTFVKAEFDFTELEDPVEKKDATIGDDVKNSIGVHCNRCKWRTKFTGGCWEVKNGKSANCQIGNQIIEG